MNTIYKLVWNTATGKYDVASELAKGRKKNGRNLLVGALAIALAASAPFGATLAASAAALPAACTTVDGQSGTINATGVCSTDTIATSSAMNSPSIGILASSTPTNTLAGGNANSSLDLAIGEGATTSGIGAIAISGSNSAQNIAYGPNSVAIGTGALSNGQDSLAFGTGASSGLSSIAIGANAFAAGTNGASVAIGLNSRVTYGVGIALGQGAYSDGAGIAIGANSHTASFSGGQTQLAIGLGATTTVYNTVALGASSVADRASTVSVGSDVAGSAFTRQIVNMSAGTQATDAVNVSQLSPVIASLGGGASINSTTGTVTGPTYNLANGGSQTTVGGALTALDGTLTQTNSNVTNLQTQIGNGTVGLVQQNQASEAISVASTTGGRSVDFTGTNGARVLSGVANGLNNTDAVNVSQLSPMVSALGGGASINTTTGVVTGPTYNLANGGTQTTVGGALTALDTSLTTTNGRVTANAGDISNLQQQIGDGTVGLVQQDAASGNVTVASATGGRSVDFTGTDGARVLNGVANGLSNTDAVNVSQLTPMVSALGGGASINPLTGAVTGPTYNLANGGTQTTVGGALTALDTSLSTTNSNVTELGGRVTTNEGSITNLQTQISDGTVGLVQQNPATGVITMASSTGGNSVDFTGTSGARVLSGLANGTGNTDAVTIAQLKAVGLVDPNGEMLGALHYDDMTLGAATLGGSNGTTIMNLARGLIASGSMQAVNGGQLFDLQESVQDKFNFLTGQYNSLNDRVDAVEQGAGTGNDGGNGSDGLVTAPGTGSGSTQVGEGADASGTDSTAIGSGTVASGDNSTATGAGSVASGDNSTATGAGSIASGNNSTADGYKAIASGENSVALGANSVADRDNTVSVGSAGNERQITNVANGTQRTDAANWGQVQDAVSGVQDWANQKFRQQDRRIDRLGAMGAAYGQMAFSAQGIATPNKVGVGVGSQGGQAALAIGYSHQLKPNMNISFGGSTSGSEVSVGAGLSVGW